MLGPNPRKVAGTPQSSSMEFPPKTAISIQQQQSTEGGLMVKAMDEIFRHVEQADNPDSFKVIFKCIMQSPFYLNSEKNKQTNILMNCYYDSNCDRLMFVLIISKEA